jgi:GDSL-like Lipase/Acylhydrolase family
MKSALHFLFFAASLFICSVSNAQKKIAVMGSSTAAGSDASSYANSWVGKMTSYFRRNMSDGLDTVVFNIAEFGYATYHEMPTGFVPPAGRPLPDPDHNVTKALSFTPDIVIINLPSNDIAFGYTKKEMMDNLRLMKSTINAAGVKCYIATTQPGNHLTPAQCQFQRDLVDSINNNFGANAIDFWSDLVTNDGLNRLRDEVRAAPSLYHLNDLGHNFLFIRVRDKQIFLTGVLPLKLTNFTASIKNGEVLLNWRTAGEEDQTFFELQKSSNGIDFETLLTQQARGIVQGADYTATDKNPFAGKTYYRLKINEQGKITYSEVATVSLKEKGLAIHKLYTDASASNLIADINTINNQTVMMSILNTAGAVVWQQSLYVTKPYTKVTIPIGNLSAGQYYFKIQGADNLVEVKGFIK